MDDSENDCPRTRSRGAGDPGRRRRRFLAAVGAALGTATTLAGCAGGPGPGGEADGEATTDGGDDATSDGDETTADGETTADDLDLREANVTDVAVERRGEAGDGVEYRFSVTLYHDDDGEDGYANWWDVETLGGRRLGRRKLLHAHGTRRFTRSETVTVPAGVDRVAVRGHDRTHGFGGQAAVVDPATGAVELVRQGPERRSLSDSDEGDGQSQS